MKVRDYVLITVAIGVGGALAGCASPVKSVHTSQLSEVEGVSYMLSRTVATATFIARLDDCGDDGKTAPTVSVLAPTVEYASAPDPAATYVINPRDAWNLFRSIDVQKLDLSDDGRIAALQVSTTDNTVTNLLEIAKAATTLGTFRERFSIQGRASPGLTGSGTQQPLLRCIGHDRPLTEDTPFAWTKARTTAGRRIEQLKSSIAVLREQTQQHAGTAAALESMSADIAKLNQEIKRLESLLSKRAEVKLVKQGAAVAMIDLKYGWFDNTSKSCGSDKMSADAALRAASGVTSAAAMRRDLKRSNNDLDHCYVGVASLQPIEAAKPLVVSDPLAASGYAGILYRLPGWVRVGLSAAVPTVAGVNLRALDDFGGVTPATHPVTWEEDGSSGGLSIDRNNEARMLQFGQMAKMPADIGLLTTNSVSADFDKNGIPKSAKWKADPVQLAALLGLPAKLQPAAPPADPTPTQAAQRDLLNALLKSCLDAFAANGAPPAYCSAILK